MLLPPLPHPYIQVESPFPSFARFVGEVKNQRKIEPLLMLSKAKITAG
jgi:hypothetical protein